MDISPVVSPSEEQAPSTLKMDFTVPPTSDVEQLTRSVDSSSFKLENLHMSWEKEDSGTGSIYGKTGMVFERRSPADVGSHQKLDDVLLETVDSGQTTDSRSVDLHMSWENQSENQVSGTCDISNASTSAMSAESETLKGQRASELESFDKLKALLIKVKPSFYDFREPVDSSDESEEEGNILPPCFPKDKRRTFSQCDSPGDCNSDTEIDDLEDKNRLKNRSSDYEQNMKKYLDQMESWNKISSQIEPSAGRISRSDNEISTIKKYCCKIKSSVISGLSIRSSSVPITSQTTDHKLKTRFKKIFSKFFRSKTETTSQSADTVQNANDSSSSKKNLTTESKSDSKCSETYCSLDTDEPNFLKTEVVTAGCSGSQTHRSFDTEELKLPQMISMQPPDIFKVPAVRSKRSNGFKTPVPSPSPPQTLKKANSTHSTSNGGHNSNTEARSAFSPCSPVTPTDPALRSYHSLPNITEPPRKIQCSRSMDSDQIQTATRALFTGNPEPRTPYFGESFILNDVKLLLKNLETNDSLSNSEELSPGNSSKTECSKRKICRKLYLDSPEKERTNTNSTLQDQSSVELIGGISSLEVSNLDADPWFPVPRQSSEDPSQPSVSPLQEKQKRPMITRTPTTTVSEIPANFDPETGEKIPKCRQTGAKTSKEDQTDKEDYSYEKDDVSGGFLSLPSCSYKDGISPPKRKVDEIEIVPAVEALLQEKISTGRPVKKGRLSLQLGPDDICKKTASTVKTEGSKSPQERKKESAGLLSPPTQRSEKNISPSKRKAEELYVEPDAEPSVKDSDGRFQESLPSKRTKVKPPTPPEEKDVAKSLDEFEKKC